MPNYRDQWVNYCMELAEEPAELYSGCRKILRGKMLSFTDIDNSLQLQDCGFTSAKIAYLRKAYLHEESRDACKTLWEKRVGQGRYGSVGFTTYNHFVKGPGGKRGSIMGPCIQSVVITLLDRRTYSLDVFYRTTELFKKFPADLVFIRDILLEPFSFKGLELEAMNCHFANITCHPMYYVTLVPSIGDSATVVEELDLLRKRDPFFWKWVIKWTSRYICEEYYNGIEKFGQAMRVHMDANKRINPKVLKSLQGYVRKNHPGFRNSKGMDDAEEQDD